jgi:hypothetical protein
MALNNYYNNTITIKKEKKFITEVGPENASFFNEEICIVSTNWCFAKNFCLFLFLFLAVCCYKIVAEFW